MTKLRVIFLLSVSILCSGYSFRCLFFCAETTAIQHDYTKRRDECRDYAQRNLDAAVVGEDNPRDVHVREEKLVSLFGECMGKQGWDITIEPSRKKPKRKEFAPSDAPIEVVDTLPVARSFSFTESVKSEAEAVKKAKKPTKKKQSSGKKSSKATNKKADSIVKDKKAETIPTANKQAKTSDVPKTTETTKARIPAATKTEAVEQKPEPKTMQATNISKQQTSTEVSKKDTDSKRRLECETARQWAAKSGNAAKMAQECQKECEELSKKSVNSNRPAACPKNNAAVTVLDSQLDDSR